METLAGLNPLTSAVTIASTTFLSWRKNNLEPGLIALEPQHGRRKHQVNQSQEALEWLEFEDSKLGGMGRIQHVRNSRDGEAKVLTPAQAYFVDGYDEVTPRVYEFHGCWYHGCKRCFKQRDVTWNCHPDRTVEQVYKATQQKTMLWQGGYTVIETGECEYQQDKKTDPQLQEFLKSYEIVPPLNPREAFFGGRTGATTLYAKADPEKEIKYQDYTSLYPWVNKYSEYPVRFPEFYLNPSDQEIDHYFGVALVDVFSPERLFHPVLPIRGGGKLTFPLCGQCVKDEQQKPWLERSNMCPHSKKEGTIRGTWSTIELQKAKEKGYHILKIHEKFHCKPESRRVGLFAEYVNTSLKLKQESAGWPDGCVSEEQKVAYLTSQRVKSNTTQRVK